jgi:ketosteroid isomerase-like protein
MVALRVSPGLLRGDHVSTNRKIVQSWFDLIAAGDATAAFALFAKDVRYTLKGSTPISGTYVGLQSLVDEFFTPWRKQIVGDIVLTVDELIGDGDRIMARARGSARTIYDLPYDNDYVFIFGLSNGQITEVIEYLDTALVETAAYGKRLSAPA